MLLLGSFLLATICVGYVQSCAEFRFPTLPSNKTLTLTEEAKVTVPFNIDTSTCRLGNASPSVTSTYNVYVSEPRRRIDSLHPDYCAVSFGEKGAGCRSHTPDRCLCRFNGREGVAELSKTVNKGDNGTWEWRTGDGSAPTAEVTFVIRPREEVTSTPITSQVVTSDADVEDDVSTVTTTVVKVQRTDSVFSKSEVDKETSTILAVNNMHSQKEDTDDATGDVKMSNTVMMAIIVGSANFATIVVIAILFVVCRRKRSKKRVQKRLGALPAVPASPARVFARGPDVTRDAPLTMYDVAGSRLSTHCYDTGPGPRPVSNRIYEEIPAERNNPCAGASAAEDSHYLTPAPSRKSTKSTAESYPVL